MKAHAILAISLILAVASGCDSTRPASAQSSAATAVASATATPANGYVCPMHPDVRDTKPSKCPKCGMTLEPADKGNAH